MARRLTTNQEIAGSTPASVNLFGFDFFSLASKSGVRMDPLHKPTLSKDEWSSPADPSPLILLFLVIIPMRIPWGHIYFSILQIGFTL